MIRKEDKNTLRKARHNRVRKKVKGTPDCPRLNVYRSLNHIYAQVIDDTAGNTLVSASTMEAGMKEQADSLNKVAAAKEVGKLVAQRAQANGIKTVVFDRGGYIYTGRVAAVAEGAREGGLEF
ncbi:MAG: 50S ribosomal protein L18 [Christensenellales bacterium]